MRMLTKILLKSLPPGGRLPLSRGDVAQRQRGSGDGRRPEGVGTLSAVRLTGGFSGQETRNPPSFASQMPLPFLREVVIGVPAEAQRRQPRVRWGESEQRNERAFAVGGSEGYEACDDEGRGLLDAPPDLRAVAARPVPRGGNTQKNENRRRTA